MYLGKFLQRNFVEKSEAAGTAAVNAIPEQSNQSAPPVTTENAPSIGPGQQSNSEEKRLFTQEELDAKIRERLERERESVRQKREQEQADAERSRLAEEQKFKELSERQASDIKTLTGEKETLTAKVTALEEELSAYKRHFEAQLVEQKKALSEPVQTLLGGLTPMQQAAWIAENSAKLGVKGVPPSPRGEGGSERSPVDEYITSLNGKGEEKK